MSELVWHNRDLVIDLETGFPVSQGQKSCPKKLESTNTKKRGKKLMKKAMEKSHKRKIKTDRRYSRDMEKLNELHALVLDMVEVKEMGGYRMTPPRRGPTGGISQVKVDSPITQKDLEFPDIELIPGQHGQAYLRRY